MELKKFVIIILVIFINSNLLADTIKTIKPNKSLSAYDVVKIQLEALKNNDANMAFCSS